MTENIPKIGDSKSQNLGIYDYLSEWFEDCRRCPVSEEEDESQEETPDAFWYDGGDSTCHDDNNDKSNTEKEKSNNSFGERLRRLSNGVRPEIKKRIQKLGERTANIRKRMRRFSNNINKSKFTEIVVNVNTSVHNVDQSVSFGVNPNKEVIEKSQSVGLSSLLVPSFLSLYSASGMLQQLNITEKVYDFIKSSWGISIALFAISLYSAGQSQQLQNDDGEGEEKRPISDRAKAFWIRTFTYNAVSDKSLKFYDLWCDFPIDSETKINYNICRKSFRFFLSIRDLICFNDFLITRHKMTWFNCSARFALNCAYLIGNLSATLEVTNKHLEVEQHISSLIITYCALGVLKTLFSCESVCEKVKKIVLYAIAAIGLCYLLSWASSFKNLTKTFAFIGGHGLAGAHFFKVIVYIYDFIYERKFDSLLGFFQSSCLLMGSVWGRVGVRNWKWSVIEKNQQIGDSITRYVGLAGVLLFYYRNIVKGKNYFDENEERRIEELKKKGKKTPQRNTDFSLVDIVVSKTVSKFIDIAKILQLSFAGK